MRILILSDLHLCGDGIVDKFQWGDQEFIDKIEATKVKYRANSVVFNGDVEENYFYSSKKVRQNHAKFFEYIEKTHNTYRIKGNHDFNKKINKTLEWGDVLIQHGDLGDYDGGVFGTIRRVLKESRNFILNRLYILTSFTANIYQNAFSSHETTTLKQEKKSLCNLRYALRILNRSDIIIVVFGHTHVLQKFETVLNGKKKVYLNSGSCANKHFEGAVVDTDTKECFIFQD